METGTTSTMPVTAVVNGRHLPGGATSHPEPLTGGEILLGVAAFGGWVVCFTAGLMVGTSEYRAHLSRPQALTLTHFLSDAIIVLTCFTFTDRQPGRPHALAAGGMAAP